MANIQARSDTCCTTKHQAALETVLGKCLQIDLINYLDDFRPSNLSISPINGYLLRGSSALLFAPSQNSHPRNPGDLDLIPLGLHGTNFYQTNGIVRKHLRNACDEIGAAVDFFLKHEEPITSLRGAIGRFVVMPILVGGPLQQYKMLGRVSKDMRNEDVRHILDNPETYHLHPREQQLLG